MFNRTFGTGLTGFVQYASPCGARGTSPHGIFPQFFCFTPTLFKYCSLPLVYFCYPLLPAPWKYTKSSQVPPCVKYIKLPSAYTQIGRNINKLFIAYIGCISLCKKKYIYIYNFPRSEVAA